MSYDDHEVIDNFGSSPDHQSARFRTVREGALDACWDYQGLRVASETEPRPASFHFELTYGNVGVFVMDVRSGRRFENGHLHIYDDAQHADLRDFLRTSSRKSAVVIVTGVPIVHVPDWMCGAASIVDRGHTDLSDRWAVPGARPCRKRLLGLLHDHQREHPAQRIILVAGDVHTGSAHELTWRGTNLRMLHLNASALSNRKTTFLQWMMQKAPDLVSRIDIGAPYPTLDVRRLSGVADRRLNPCGELNLGLLEFTRVGDELALRIKLVAHDPTRGSARVVFESEAFRLAPSLDGALE